MCLRLGLSQMVPINGAAVTAEFAQDFRIAAPGRLQCLQREHRRAFAQGQTIPPGVERAADGRGESLA